MKLLAAGIALLALAASPRLFASAPEDARFQVEVTDGEGGQVCTIRAGKAPVDALMGELASQLDLRLVGFDSVARAALVDVVLDRRPVFEAVEAILGSVGLVAELRPGVLAVRPENTLGLSAEELTNRAMVAYLRALGRHPDHDAAAGARLAQGKVELRRGNAAAALAHFETLIESYKASPLVPEGLLCAGLALERLQLWNEAQEQFRALATWGGTNVFGAEARFELARCAIELGDNDRALSVLANLDASHPAEDAGEEGRRTLLRARALNGSGQSMHALRMLDQAERLGLEAEERHVALALRAEAFEALDLPGEASRAWLIHSRDAEGPDRVAALENAARLALADGDELGAIFVAEQARADGFGAALEPYAREARLRLGLDVQARPAGGTIEDELTLADAWLRGGEAARAVKLLEPLYAKRSGLDEEARVGVAGALARGLEATRGLDAAIALLHRTRGELDLLESRQRLDLVAADLFEQHERFDDAIDAFQGRY